MALQLKRRGITRVHPLEGGLAAWKALNFPVLAVEAPAVAPGRSASRLESGAA